MGTALADEADEISQWCVLLKTFVVYCIALGTPQVVLWKLL